MKILVTGASGFIGNYVIQYLVNIGKHEIIATALNRSEVEKYDWLPKVTFIECDLNKKNENYFQFFSKPDLMIHLSWQGLPNYKELYHFENNLFTNYYFIKNIIENGLKDVSVIGTCFEYGMQSGCLSETLETKPGNPYGLAKDTLRKFIEELQKKHTFIFKWIRLFYLYGKGQGQNSIISQLDRALENNEKVFNMSGGEQLRDYLPVDRAAEYVARISIQNEVLGIINCCNGEPISIRKFVENYLEMTGKKIELNLGYYPYPDYEPMAFWGDNSKLLKIIQ